MHPLGWPVSDQHLLCLLASQLIRRPHVILDKEGLVVGVLAGQPRDPDWDRVHNEAFEALGSAASRIRCHPKEVTNRRGPFPTLAYGISFGGGQQVRSFLIPRLPTA